MRACVYVCVRAFVRVLARARTCVCVCVSVYLFSVCVCVPARERACVHKDTHGRAHQRFGATSSVSNFLRLYQGHEPSEFGFQYPCSIFSFS